MILVPVEEKRLLPILQVDFWTPVFTVFVVYCSLPETGEGAKSIDDEVWLVDRQNLFRGDFNTEATRQNAIRTLNDKHSRTVVGVTRPGIVWSQTEPTSVTKKAFDASIAQSACPAHTEWRTIRVARDINDTEVQVFQPPLGTGQPLQWFYTVTCKNHALRSRRQCPGCCIGIDHSTFMSSCRQKKSYVLALLHRQHTRQMEWAWIQVDTSCNCAITPIIHSDL